MFAPHWPGQQAPRCFLLTALPVWVLLIGAATALSAETLPQKPNVLWLIAEDLGTDLACYGDPDARTPNLDRLASQGRMYRNAFATGNVCSPARSAFCTGMYQTSLDAQNQRSHRHDHHPLPSGVRLMTDRLREVGYCTANIHQFPSEISFLGAGKTDWNFEPEGKPFDSSRWQDLKSHQPFYAQVNFHDTHRPYAKAAQHPTDPAQVTLPPYLPDHPVAREDWALYHDSIQTLDGQVGQVLNLLKTEGLAENTIVFFFGDQGRECFRGKYYAYEQGIHVPLLVRWPGVLPTGSSSDDLVSLIDVTATSLVLAGVTLPQNMHGQPFLGEGAQRREYVIAASDRCDEAVDRVRTVRDNRYKYMRNFMPERPYLQHMVYAERTNPNVNLMRQLYAEGKLNAAQAKFMAPRRPAEELYDLRADPWELNNLAALPEHQETLARFRSVLEKWIVETDDRGRFPEDPAVLKEILEEHQRSVEKLLKNSSR
jgi:N-sulfoglucosamine sulfohydrolase